MNTPVLVRREEFGVGRKQLEISNEKLGIGDGVGFIMNFICEVTGRYADDYYIVFSMLCRTFIMYVIRRGAHCAPASMWQVMR